eukprot:scpid12970/ scgid32847/ 
MEMIKSFYSNRLPVVPIKYARNKLYALIALGRARGEEKLENKSANQQTNTQSKQRAAMHHLSVNHRTLGDDHDKMNHNFIHRNSTNVLPNAGVKSSVQVKDRLNGHV